MLKVKRGQIYMALLDRGFGSEQGGQRPVLIIQNDIGNAYSPVTIVAPITSSRNKRNLPTHVTIEKCGLHTESIALLEQIRAIDKIRLQNLMGKADDEIMEKVNEALRISVGL